MEEAKEEVVHRLLETVKEISGYPECQNTSKKLYSNLLRRVKLLSPLFEELKDSEQAVGEEQVRALLLLNDALLSAKLLLQSVNQGSKLYQVLPPHQLQWFLFLHHIGGRN